jgi:hypothetical protein
MPLMPLAGATVVIDIPEDELPPYTRCWRHLRASDGPRCSLN